MYKVIYLAAGKAQLKYENVVYNDYFLKRDLVCDMMQVDLSDFDILIATPPCNYYSRANSFRETSVYSQSTKHLLPDIIDKFIKTGKPFIVENVRNAPMFRKLGLYDKNCFIYTHGRHTYWTNILINFSNIPQEHDFGHKEGCKHVVRLKPYVQGGKNVNDCLDFWVETVISRLQLVNAN